MSNFLYFVDSREKITAKLGYLPGQVDEITFGMYEDLGAFRLTLENLEFSVSIHKKTESSEQELLVHAPDWVEDIKLVKPDISQTIFEFVNIVDSELCLGVCTADQALLSIEKMLTLLGFAYANSEPDKT